MKSVPMISRAKVYEALALAVFAGFGRRFCPNDRAANRRELTK
jgi:hypothetical protein